MELKYHHFVAAATVVLSITSCKTLEQSHQCCHRLFNTQYIFSKPIYL